MKRLLAAVCFAFLLAPTAQAFAGKDDAQRWDAAYEWNDGDHEAYASDPEDSGDDENESERHYLTKKWGKHLYHRGEALPVLFLEQRYYVDDYDRHGLTSPPLGHHWIQTDDGDYFLVAVATGLITDIHLNP